MSKPEFCFCAVDYEMLERLGAIMNMAQIAAFFKVTPDVLRRELETDQEAKTAILAGRAKAIYMAGSNLLSLVRDGDRASIFFYLKTKGGYRETSRLDTGTSDDDFGVDKFRHYQINFVAPDDPDKTLDVEQEIIEDAKLLEGELLTEKI